MSSMLEVLNKRVDEALDSTLGPLAETRQSIVEALGEVRREERDLEAQLERCDRVLDAAKLRRKPGRAPGPQGGSKRQKNLTAVA